MNKTIRYIMYGLVITMCLVAIFVGVSEEVFKKKNIIENEIVNTVIENVIEPISNENKDAFLDLFMNEFYEDNFNDANIEKMEDSLPIVVNRVKQKESVEGKYNIDVNIPIININSEAVEKYNQNTLEKFVNIIDQIKTADIEIYYNVSFTAYINNDILSVAIKALLKEGDKPQKLVIETYNYNVATKQNVTISDILKNRGLETRIVNSKIKEIVEQAQNYVTPVTEVGYNIFKRNIDSKEYEVMNVNNFIQGPNGELYLIYAYGNKNYTTELDVVII